MVVKVGKKELKPVRHTTIFDLLKGVKKVKVRMLQDRKAAEDGINPKLYEAGQKYDVREDLAQSWLDEGIAELDKAHPGPKETKKRTRRKK